MVCFWLATHLPRPRSAHIKEGGHFKTAYKKHSIATYKHMKRKRRACSCGPEWFEESGFLVIKENDLEGDWESKLSESFIGKGDNATVCTHY